MRKIAGIHVCENGDIACVWLNYEPLDDSITICDSCVFKREVPIVIAEGLNARGRWIPIAWNDKSIADSLTQRGCRMLPEQCDDKEVPAEMVSRDIWERMRTHRFKVDKRLGDWFDEARSFEKDNNKIPRDSHPLMAATRHAVQMLSFARAAEKPRKQTNTRRLAIV